MSLVRKLLVVALIGGLMAGMNLGGPATAFAVPTDLDLAYRWAPIHYQDTDSSDYDADYVTAIDYDGEWNTLNNWDNQDNSLSRLKAKVYFSVVETSTHWYIVYSFYHPRDWDDNPIAVGTEHENDLEGAMMVVRKDGSVYGALQGMVTVFHRDFYSYTDVNSSWTNGQENVDGKIITRLRDGALHPTTFQEAKGHGLKAWNGDGFPGGDGVIYYPSRTLAEVPASGKDSFVSYQLVDTFASGGLWAHRSDPLTFASWGVFRGDNGSDNSANAPWKWNDHDDDAAVPSGALANDPAKLVDIYFNNLGTFSLTYTRNGFR